MNKSITLTLSPREHAHILAALRHLQDMYDENFMDGNEDEATWRGNEYMEGAECTWMTDAELDDFIGRIA